MISGAFIQIYLELLKRNSRISIFPNLCICIAYLCFVPLIRGISNLNAVYAAECLEKSVALIGIILLIPICQPEQNKATREVVLSKSFAYYKIVLMRLLLSIIIIIICITGFSGMMLLLKSEFPIASYVTGTFASTIALGGTGFLAAVIFNNIIIGYLTSIGYFLLNWTGVIGIGHKLHLFSMSSGSFEEKYWLFALGIICCGGVVIYNSRIQTV